MFLFKRKKKDEDDEPVDLEARSPVTGLKYKDIALLGEIMKTGADITKPRHVLYYLYFTSREDAETGAVEGRAGATRARFATRCPSTRTSGAGVRADRRGPGHPDRRAADDLFQGIADRLKRRVRRLGGGRGVETARTSAAGPDSGRGRVRCTVGVEMRRMPTLAVALLILSLALTGCSRVRALLDPPPTPVPPVVQPIVEGDPVVDGCARRRRQHGLRGEEALLGDHRRGAIRA